MDSVRIDKFLWAIRVFKTRSDATEACKGNKVTIAGAAVKPSREVKEGDVISVRKGAVQYSYRTVALLEKRVGAKEESKLGKLIGNSIAFFVLVSVILSVLLVVCARPLAILMQAPEDAGRDFL